MKEKSPKGRKYVQSYAQAGDYITLGLQFGITIMLCLFGGRWIDGKLGTTPIFLLLGTFFGAGAGMYNLYKRLVTNQKKKPEEEEDV